MDIYQGLRRANTAEDAVNKKRVAADILDIYAHPMNGPSVVSWLLDSWDNNPDAELVILTARGDGPKLIGRIRVTVSQTRKQLGLRAKKFTLRTSVIDWSYGESITLDAVCVKRVIAERHVVAETFNAMLGGKDGNPK